MNVYIQGILIQEVLKFLDWTIITKIIADHFSNDWKKSSVG